MVISYSLKGVKKIRTTLFFLAGGSHVCLLPGGKETKIFCKQPDGDKRV